MSTNSTTAPAAAGNPLARFTAALFGLVPTRWTMLVLRIALARCRSCGAGQTGLGRLVRLSPSASEAALRPTAGCICSAANILSPIPI